MQHEGTEGAEICFWLEYSGRRFFLSDGRTLIGRAANCQIVLDDALVSRRHAQLLVKEQRVTVVDLGSANGLQVNGDRAGESTELTPGDVLTIGQQEMVLRSGPRPNRRVATSRFSAKTLTGVEAADLLGGGPNSLEAESTHGTRTLMLLGGVADKVLALGRGEEAERVLGNFLHKLLEAVCAGEQPEGDTVEKAVGYAVRIASATGKGSWVDYCIQMYSELKKPLPTAVVDELYTVLRKVSDIDRKALKAYVGLLRERQNRFGPAERFLMQRIEGLERLAALK
jgi:hypothetical protein